MPIVNPSAKYDNLPLHSPPPTGYLHLAAVVGATVGRTPFPRRSPRKARLLAALKVLATSLTRLDTVTRATVYQARLIPPTSRDARQAASHPARYDVAVLIETPSVEVLDSVQASSEYQELLATLRDAATDLYVMPARCIRLVADVDKSRPGLFLFNYFVADNRDVALDVWEHLAGWYAAHTGMDNSTLLGPLDDTDYVFVNHVRWDRSLASFTLAQFGTPSFRSYVLANLRANHTASMPILFRLASGTR
jgi:hypothetical protein